MFILCVDRDGIAGRKQQLEEIERQAARVLGERSYLLAENAWQELEVWVLAGHELPMEWKWAGIRQESNPKETYFLPFAKARNVLQGPGEGRKTLALEAAKRYERIRRLCPEDIGELERRIKDLV